MWLILLDRSGSMGDPFSGAAEFGGRVRTTNEQVKLDAAKAALREHLAGLGVPTAITIVGFNTAASTVYEGSSSDSAAIERALTDVTASGGTSVAAALDFGARLAHDVGDGSAARALLISDGLDDADEAEAAAMRTRGSGLVTIDVILIDPTEDGEEVARRVAAGGSVSAVASSEALSEDVRRAAREQLLSTGDPEAVAAVARQDATAVLDRVAPGEPVAFTAWYPGTILGGTWYSLLLFLHLDHLQAAVDEFAAARVDELGTAPGSTRATGFHQIPRGTVLRLTPTVGDLVFNPTSQDVAWVEDIQAATWRVSAAADAQLGPRTGAIEVHAGPLLIAVIPLAIRVRDPTEQEEPQRRTTEHPLQRVFASYSHADEDVVRACTQAYEAFGITMFVDKETLRSGQRWEETLHRLIDESDQFQLYWSASAKSSSYVEDEWRHALRLQSLKGETFIRPLYWERPLAAPPRELSHLHFARLDVTELARATRLPAGNAVPQPPRASPRRSVPVAVVPLLPFVGQKRIDEVRADAAEAAAFVEEVSGLRYYPAPTLIVDEHAVRTVRNVVFPVDAPLPDVIPATVRGELLALLDVVGAIALAFHVRSLHPDLDYRTFGARFGEGTVLPADEWELFRFRSEGFLHRVASVYREPVPELAAVLSGPTDAPDTPSLSDVEEFFEQLISCLDEGVRTSGEFRCELGYAVRVRSWNLVSRAAPDAIETREPEPSWLPPKEPELLLAGPFSAMLTLFRTASARILDILRAAGGPQDSVVRAVETAVPTYGIYAPPTSPSSDAALHDWAIERGIPPQLTLSGAPRILLCLSAQDRFVDSLIEAGDVADPTALARSFQRTVLVHEHFHAAVETSLDDGGDLPVGPADATAWQRGMPLNEALATWSELHLARADEPLSRAIWEYVRSGPYPEWPYRGAEGVERRFADEGVDGVRRLIAALRTDPAGAAADFEVRA